jgi:serine/threonine-protein kinase RsbW
MQILSCNMEAHLSFEEKDDIEKFLGFSEEIIENIVTCSDTKYKLKSAIHELVINSLEHGYKKTSGKVSISFLKTDSYIQFEIADTGEGFDFSTINLDKTVKSLDCVSSRGWGLAITNKLCDGFVINNNEPNGTKITVKFSLE